MVDCNNFYASCERVFQPKLKGQPIVILSNNDGCIISRSDEAKALGIPMGAPEFKFRQELKEKNIHVFSSNYALYGDLSRRVMDILRQFTPHVEEYSIDEAFMNFDGVDVPDNDFFAYGSQMKNRIHQWLSIPVCVGIAPTKALSKAANKIARKFPEKTGGVYVIDTDEKRIKALKWTRIEDVWGIGYRLKKKAKAQNIHTALDFIQPQHEGWIRRQMGVVGLRLKSELEGSPLLEIDENPWDDRKNIAVTRSFPKQLSDFDGLRERVATFASVCAEKLRGQGSCCHTVTVMLVVDTHQTDRAKYQHFNKSVTLPFATNSTLTISDVSVAMLRELYAENENMKFKKAGVIVSQLIDQDKKQFRLFEEENPRHLAIMKAMDELNAKIGDRKIKLGAQDLTRTWNMNQRYLTSRYTTNFKQILEIECR